jgi:predicted ATPase/DNA-binding XRE family transcriptional regulator
LEPAGLQATPSEFGELLRRFRVAANLSQDELAQRAGLSVRGISDLERGARRAPYPHTVSALADALGLTAEDHQRLLTVGTRRRSTTPTRPQRPDPGRTNLPVPVTSFIGREDAQSTVRRLLERSRMVTLSGTGGVGKTRLAIETAAGLTDSYPGGVWLVELAPLTDATFLAQEVARTLGVRESPTRSVLDSVVAALAERACLLVLDNCEHLVGEVAAFVATLLHRCPPLRLLATSRAALGVVGETVWWVPSLPLPEATAGNGPPRHSAAGVLRAAAGQLFGDRAAAAHPAFTVTDDNAAAVAAICRRLDGLPLAIELAAARARILTPAQIAAHLDERFRLLTGGAPEAPTRQQTLRAALDWSHDLLAEPERVLLRRLSVFAGGCTLDAVEAVCVDEEAPREALFDLLSGLVEKSLVVVEYRGEAARYRMLETIGAYAAERLTIAGEADAIRIRLAGWAMALARGARPHLSGPDQGAWLERLETEHDNVRAALRWALDEDQAPLGLQLAVAVWRFWQTRSYLSEGRAWLDRLLNAAARAPGSVRAAALLGTAALATDQGDYTTAVSYAEQSVALFREVDDAEIVEALHLLGGLCYRQSNYAASRAYAEECLTLARATNDQRLIARSLNLLGLTALDEGRYEAAHQQFAESLAFARAAGDVRVTAVVLNNLGLTAQRVVDLPRARVYLEEALALNRALGNRVEISRNLITLAAVSNGVGEPEAAEQFAKEALTLSREIGNRNGITEALNQLTPIARARGDLEAARGWSAMHLREAGAMAYPVQMVAALHEAAVTARAGGLAHRAVCLIAAAEAGREAIGLAQIEETRRAVEEHVAALRDQLDEQTFAAAWASGVAMTLEEAIDHALTDGDARPRHSAGGGANGAAPPGQAEHVLQPRE